MIRTLTTLFAITALTGAAVAAKLTVKDLPAAVQKTVNDNLKGGGVKISAKKPNRASPSTLSSSFPPQCPTALEPVT